MTLLSSLSPEDAALITSLPYRVGVHISYAEDEEGGEDDEREMRALKYAIREIAKMHEKEVFLKSIAKEILSREEKWPQWQEESVQVVTDCKRALQILQSNSTPQDVKDYRRFVLEIATTVAQAYGEFGDFEEEDEGFIQNTITKIVKGFSSLSGDDKNHPMNVSPAEDTAIGEIAAALKLK